MTERENLMRVINGKEPAWVPRKGALQYGYDPENHKVSYMQAAPVIFPVKYGPSGGRMDVFGVEFEAADGTGGMELPLPNKFILDDITKWRDVIKAPSLDGIDWETVAKKSIAHIDRRETAVGMPTHIGYFQHVINFMGFTNGLIALIQEPEEVMALCEYLADYYEIIARNLVTHIRPDIFCITDDTATALNPFFSREIYQKLFKPYHARLGKIACDLDLPIDMHNCGRCEDFIDDWREFGVVCWNPAQVINDLAGIKKKYGNSLVLNGCWDSTGPAGWLGSDEELVRQAVRDCIDAYAPGGGFCFWASFYGRDDDEQAKAHALWITDEYNKYGRTFYKRQG